MIAITCHACYSGRRSGLPVRMVEAQPGERLLATRLPDGWSCEIDERSGDYRLLCPYCSERER